MTRCLLITVLILSFGIVSYAQQTNCARLAVNLRSIQGLHIKKAPYNDAFETSRSAKLEVLSVGKFVVKVSTVIENPQIGILRDKAVAADAVASTSLAKQILSSVLEGSLTTLLDIDHKAYAASFEDNKARGSVPTIIYTIEAH